MSYNEVSDENCCPVCNYSHYPFDLVRTCRGVLDCEWCEYSKDGSSLLDDPYCATQRECFGGVLGAATPYGDQIGKHPQFEDDFSPVCDH